MKAQVPLPLVLTLALSLNLIGCGGDSDQHKPSWACPTVYAPVCGLVAQGNSFQYQTFSNSCVASNKSAQISFEGQCEALEGQITQASQPIIIHKTIDDLPGAATSLEVVDSEINDHIAAVTVQYGGGCSEHAIHLHVAPPFMESWPLQIHARLTHQTDDSCEALITHTLSIDLLPLKELYHTNYQEDSGEIMIPEIGLYSF
ncbi:MAG TPA: hypothetical protein VIC08_03725 [Cellvibrionaceae bacterium]